MWVSKWFWLGMGLTLFAMGEKLGFWGCLIMAQLSFMSQQTAERDNDADD